MTTSYSEDLALALSLADAADELTMSRFEAANLICLLYTSDAADDTASV